MPSVPPPEGKEPSRVFQYLDSIGIPHVNYDHGPADTVEELLKEISLHGIPGVPTKNLFLKAKKASSLLPPDQSLLWLIIAAHDTDISLSRFSKLHGYKDQLRFATEDLLVSTLGISKGHVSVFSLMNDFEGVINVCLDPVLLQSEQINAHPLHNAASTVIAGKDLMKFVEATGHKSVYILSLE